MKVLVTGANGYLGSGIVRRLLDDGCSVVATDFKIDNCDERADRFACDLFSVDNPYEYFGKPDAVLHLAWRDGFVHNSEAHLADLALHHKFLEEIFASGATKVAVMGSMHEAGYVEGCVDENTPCNPMTLYGIAKNALRCDAFRLAEKYKKKCVWLRGFYIVGNTESGSSVFSKIYGAAKEGKTRFPFTLGQNKYDFIDYSDFCLQVATVMEQDGVEGIINICSGRPEKLADRAERFIKDNNLNIKLDYGAYPDRPYDSDAIWGDSTAIDKILQKRRGKILVTGAHGQLGHDVVAELERRGYSPVGVDIEDMDITDELSVKSVFERVRPEAVVHCAAWTAVDAAEDNEQKVRAVNALGTEYIAKQCKAFGAKLMYISTDYVFDGQGDKPWEPDCKDYKPLNVYGKTKLEGELAVSCTLEKYFIVRIAWAFGKNGNNFISTMLKLGKKYQSLRVVNDQIGTPTYTLDLARLLVDMIATQKYGYYHATNEGGYISWYDFACEIFRQAGYTTEVIPVTTAEYGLSKAVRPFNSRLEKGKLIENGFTPLPNWKDALSRYLKSVEEEI